MALVVNNVAVTILGAGTEEMIKGDLVQRCR